jgi:YfiR/HmsC-like
LIQTSTTRSSKSAGSQCGPRNGVRNRCRRVWQCPTAAIAMLALLHITVLGAQQPKVSEYQVKAIYLYNFGRFVQWPPNATAAKGDSFSICVLGQDPFGPSLDSTVAGETLDGKPLAARRISTPRDAGECRILFISSTEENHLKEILAALDESSILTVSDMPAFSRRGGMIQFVLEGDKVRFEINLTKAETAKLTLSSELLKVATTVRRNVREGGA